MSGHNKWSKIKHQKKVTDAKKGKAFTKAARSITIAVVEGGGITDPEKNVRLRLAIEQAKQVNMPKDNVARAIQRATSKDRGKLEKVVYEAYAPGNIALIVEAATDNRNRTVAQIKHVLERAGGRLVQSGAVSYMFSQCGTIAVKKTPSTSLDEMTELALQAGADDVQESDTYYEFFTDSQKLHDVLTHIQAKGEYDIIKSERIYKATTTVSTDDATKQKLDIFIEKVEDVEDVVQVYTNAV